VFDTLGKDLNLEYEAEEKNDIELRFQRIVKAATERGKTAGPLLLLFDNVDTYDLLLNGTLDTLHLDNGTLHILATTRLEASKIVPNQEIHWLPIDELPQEAALRLLEKHRPFKNEAENEAALRIVHDLGGYTLLIELVAVYLANEPSVSYAGLHERLGHDVLKVADELGVIPEVVLRRHKEKLLPKILGPTLALLKEEERYVLLHGSLLPPDSIPLPWLRELAGAVYPALVAPPDPGYPDPWEKLLSRLSSMRLLTKRSDTPGGPEGSLAHMHRIIQALIREELSVEDRAGYDSDILKLVKSRAHAVTKPLLTHEADEWEIHAILSYVSQRLEEGGTETTGGSVSGSQFADIFKIPNMLTSACTQLGLWMELVRVCERAYHVSFKHGAWQLAAEYAGTISFILNNRKNIVDSERWTILFRDAGIQELGSIEEQRIHQANVFDRFGWLEVSRENWNAAKQLFNEAGRIFEVMDREDGILDVVCALGWVEGMSGTYQSAMRYFEPGLADTENILEQVIAYVPEEVPLAGDAAQATGVQEELDSEIEEWHARVYLYHDNIALVARKFGVFDVSENSALKILASEKYRRLDMVGHANLCLADVYLHRIEGMVPSSPEARALLEKGSEYAAEALEIYRRTGDQWLTDAPQLVERYRELLAAR
jgi:hypothetical protein